MCRLQYINYRDNQDSSSVVNKRFEDSKEDIYPTFSICFQSESGQIFQSYDTDPMADCFSPCNNESYRENNTLECNGKCKGDEYFETITGIKMDDKNAILNSQRSKYLDKIVNVASTILKFETVTTEGKIIQHIENEAHNLEHFNLAFAMTYQDPWNLCFTRRQTSSQSKLLRYDYLEVNDGSSYLNRAKYNYRIYVHQKGQLLRQLGTSDHILDKKLLKYEKSRKQILKKLNNPGKNDNLRRKLMGYRYEVNIRINSADVLRKRPDAIIPCNNKLYDEDAHWIKRAIDELKCIPPFFDGNKHRVTSFESIPCIKSQYENFSINYRPEYYFYEIEKLYDQPCVEMTPTVFSSRDKILNEEEASIIQGDDNRQKRNVNEKSKKSKSGFNKSNKQKNGKKEKNRNDENSQTFTPEVVPQLPCLNDSIGDLKCMMKVNIKIEYIAHGYKETINHRSFTVLSLLSQIGGVIGMFLGYSLLHLPQLVGFAATAAQNVATKDKQKDAKILWNSVKQKKILRKMNFVNVSGALDQKVNYLKECIALFAFTFIHFWLDLIYSISKLIMSLIDEEE